MITVKQLIAKLRKFPPNARVGWADHDHSEDELNGAAGRVEEATDYVKDRWNVDVVIRP